MAAAALAGLGSCTSPLELETVRIDSVVTPTMKIRAISTTVFHGDGTRDTSAIINWAFVQDTLYFNTAPNTDPPILSFYAELMNDSTVDTSAAIVLKTLRIRLSDVVANGTYPLEGITVVGRNGIYARATINDSAYGTNAFLRSPQGEIKLTYHALPVKRIEGTLTIPLSTGNGKRLLIVTEILGQI